METTMTVVKVCMRGLDRKASTDEVSMCVCFTTKETVHKGEPEKRRGQTCDIAEVPNS